VREAQLEKVPYMLVVGDKEQSARRWRCATAWTATKGALSVPELLQRLDAEVKEKRIRQVSAPTLNLGEGTSEVRGIVAGFGGGLKLLAFRAAPRETQATSHVFSHLPFATGRPRRLRWNLFNLFALPTFTRCQ